MKKLVLMIALFGMSFAFNACTDPVDEIQNKFNQENVQSPEQDGGDAPANPGPLGDE